MRLVAAVLLLFAVDARAQQPPSFIDLAGTWTVDLRLKLSDPTYSQPMILVVAPDKSVTGSFYNSEILAGRAGNAQGRICVSFRTTDGQGLYHSSACLIGGKMVGQSWAEGRGFVLPWTAERKK